MAVAIPSSLVAIVILAMFCSFAALASASDRSVLSLGSSLTPVGNQTLVSPGNNFSLGFRSLSQAPDEFYLAIWYTNLDNTIVWMANRDNPVTGRASLNLTANGGLVLSDPSLANPVWQPATGVATAEIQETGNFVLHSSSGDKVWESFDSPTDTLLPGQQLKGKAQLISRKTATGYASGRYFLHFPTSGNVALGYTNQSFGPDYWSMGTATESYTSNSSSPPTAEFNQSGNLSFSNSSGVYQTYIPGDFQAESIRRLTLDMDGNLRMYSWDESSSSWTRVWFFVTDQCTNIKGLCGSYGICIYNPEPACVCPPGFHVADFSDLSGGCTPNISINCDSSKYVVLDNTDFPNNDISNTSGVSMTECIQSCTADCNCLSAVYWQYEEVRCWLKQAQIINGYSAQSQNACTFLKVSDSYQATVNLTFDVITQWTSGPVWLQSNSNGTPNATVHKHSFTNNKAVLVILSIVIVAQLLGFGSAVLVLLRKNARTLRQSKLHGDLEGISGSTVRFCYQELEAATNNFSERLGSGGFGTVYKGNLANGRVVAVKLLEGVSQREKQFQAEIATIGRIHHINLLRLCGFCAEGDHRLLVYDYMENGSLDSILFHESGEAASAISLDWKTRFEICLGIARGISYLHEECLDCILHCDIKPQNILLDKNCCPKVADCGLARLFSRNHTVKVTTIRGTRGYLAPEWVSNLPITIKADVFSFGMVLLEIVSGRRNYLFTSSNLESDRWCFPEWAFQQLSKGSLEAVLDPKLNGNVDYEQVQTVLTVAFCCIHVEVSARPSMGRVVQMLEGTVPAPEPPAPNLFFEGFEAEEEKMSEEKSLLGSTPSCTYSSFHID